MTPWPTARLHTLRPAVQRESECASSRGQGSLPFVVLRRSWATAIATAAITGCGYYDSSLLEAAASATDAGGSTDSGACTSERPPGPPSVKDAGGGAEIVVALKTVDFHESSGSNTIGYDLDNTCTCLGQGPSCVAPKDSPGSCDGPGGRDNSGAALIQASAMLGLTSGTFTQDIAEGDFSLLLRIREYNGLADDDQVSVAWLVPLTLMKPPAFDGTDVWGINGSCLHHDQNGQPNLEDPIIIDPLAYVTGGRLVASLKGGAPLNVSAQFSIVVHTAFLSGNLVKQGALWEIQDGVVCGIWRTDDLFANLRNTDVLGSPLCTNNPAYPNVKATICRSRDISAQSMNPADPCDAISLAFTFTAYPAQINVAWDPPAPVNPCAAAVDPANDTCD